MARRSCDRLSLRWDSRGDGANEAGSETGFDAISLWRGMSLRNRRTALLSPGLWPFLAKQNSAVLRSSAALRPTGSKAHAPSFLVWRCPVWFAIGARKVAQSAVDRTHNYGFWRRFSCKIRARLASLQALLDHEMRSTRKGTSMSLLLFLPCLDRSLRDLTSLKARSKLVELGGV